MKNFIKSAVVILFVLLIVIAVSLFFKRNSSPLPTPQPQPTENTTPTPILGVNTTTQTKFEGCEVNGALPDPLCTPGAIFPNVTAEDVCKPGYSKSVRNVTESVKNKVYKEYGITSHGAGQYEVDHLVSLELGGSNEISNLWPETAEPRPGFHEKDVIENYLHKEVCSGKITLEQAQNVIAVDWQKVVIEK